MAKITSKASLNVGTELTIDEPGRIITLNVAGTLVAKDGVTWQALYSKLVDLWATATYQDSPFPCYAIDALSGQFQIGTDGSTYSAWKFSDTDSNAPESPLRWTCRSTRQLADALAAQGYRVLVVDAEPADLALTSLAHALRTHEVIFAADNSSERHAHKKH